MRNISPITLLSEADSPERSPSHSPPIYEQLQLSNRRTRSSQFHPMVKNHKDSLTAGKFIDSSDVNKTMQSHVSSVQGSGVPLSHSSPNPNPIPSITIEASNGEVTDDILSCSLNIPRTCSQHTSTGKFEVVQAMPPCSSLSYVSPCHDTDIPSLDTPETTVTLPCRYRQRLVQPEVDVASPVQEMAQDDLASREKDLGTALRWIRQEILEMKEQDKSLLKQFIELRASILQLRCLHHMHGSCSDVSSLDGSTLSLNEPAKSPRLRRMVLESDRCLGQPSISLPSSPQIARFKWKSHEFI